MEVDRHRPTTTKAQRLSTGNSFGRGTAARFPRLLELGSGKHSDREMNFGRRLGEIWNEN